MGMAMYDWIVANFGIYVAATVFVVFAGLYVYIEWVGLFSSFKRPPLKSVQTQKSEKLSDTTSYSPAVTTTLSYLESSKK
jgi:hypothetical protein